ncbi:uncharacterized protein VTP21DRAFT_9087 [Calcarisporiella thermophila]|uniref:uncharacterized protein n=1 Tax=Calcarisporiella thermophila TaxID=911321 RepID=UPI003742C5CA
MLGCLRPNMAVSVQAKFRFVSGSEKIEPKAACAAQLSLLPWRGCPNSARCEVEKAQIDMLLLASPLETPLFLHKNPWCSNPIQDRGHHFPILASQLEVTPARTFLRQVPTPALSSKLDVRFFTGALTPPSTMRNLFSLPWNWISASLAPKCSRTNRSRLENKGCGQVASPFQSILKRSPEHIKIQYSVALLRDEAAVWWEFRITKNVPPVNWEEFKNDILCLFAPINTVRQARDKLANCRQTKSVQEYSHEFRNIVLQIPNFTEEELIDKYIRGLKPQTRGRHQNNMTPRHHPTEIEKRQSSIEASVSIDISNPNIEPDNRADNLRIVKLGHGSTKPCYGFTTVSIDEYNDEISFDVVDLNNAHDATLGLSWLHTTKALFDWDHRILRVIRQNEILQLREMSGSTPAVGNVPIQEIMNSFESAGPSDLFAILSFDTNASGQTTLEEFQDKELNDLLTEFAGVFPDDPPSGLPSESHIVHTIPLKEGATPPAPRVYRMSNKELIEFSKQLQDLLDKGWI